MLRPYVRRAGAAFAGYKALINRLKVNERRRYAMKKSNLNLFVPLMTGLALAFAYVWAGAATPAFALRQGDQRYVRADGNDTGNYCAMAAAPCATIQHAIDVSVPGDEILIAGGTYARAGTLAKITSNIRLIGGYNHDFTVTNPALFPTVLDAKGAGTVISVTYTTSPVTLSGLRLIHGDGTGSCGSVGCGGGIYAHYAWLVVEDCVIRNNTGSHSGMATGGGIYALAGHLTVRHSQIVSNTGSTDPANVAVWGGGVHASSGEVVLQENLISGNVGHVAYSGMGGGIYLSHVTHAEVLSNTITGNFASQGNYRSDAGGIWVNASQSVLISGNRIENNATSSHPTNGAGFGGGIYLWDTEATVTRNIISRNSAGSWEAAQRPGGGVCIQGSQPVTLTNNLITHNSGSGEGDGIFVGLGWGPAGLTKLVNNTIADNSETGIVTRQYANLSLTNNLISGHAVGLASYPPVNGTINANTNLFWNNSDPIMGNNAIHQPPLLTPSYHLGTGSPALNAGLTISWLKVDLDGEVRPQGGKYDIGAYEGAETLWMIFMPLVRR